MTLAVLKIEEIKPGDNIRKDITKESLSGLINSVKEKGILQPVLVKKNGTGYDLIAGYRRYSAAKAAGLTEIPVLITDLDKKDRINYQITENLQREDLNPIDEALAYQALGEKYKAKDIMVITGKTEYRIKKILSLLNLCADVKKMVSAGELSADHAFVVSKLSSVKQQKDLAAEIKKYRYSVVQAEEEMLNYARQLENAEFDKTACKECTFNGNLLKDLFDKDTNVKGTCLNIDCFHKKIADQQKKTAKKLEAEGKKVIVFEEEPKYGSKEYKALEEVVDFNSFEAQAFDKEQFTNECSKTCPTFAMVIKPYGKLCPTCLNKDCFKRSLKKAKAAERKATNIASTGDKDKDTAIQYDVRRKENRVDLFKRSFFIGHLLKKATELQINRITLHLLFESEPGNSESISEYLGLKKKIANWNARELKFIEGLTNKQLIDLIKKVVLSRLNNYSTADLQKFAEEVKINIAKEFVIDAEYLKNFSKDGLEKLAKELKVKLGSLMFKEKKDVIIDAMLKSGTKGKVPKEMLK